MQLAACCVGHPDGTRAQVYVIHNEAAITEPFVLFYESDPCYDLSQLYLRMMDSVFNVIFRHGMVSGDIVDIMVTDAVFADDKAGPSAVHVPPAAFETAFGCLRHVSSGTPHLVLSRLEWMQCGVVVKTLESQSVNPGSIPGTSTCQPSRSSLRGR